MVDAGVDRDIRGKEGASDHAPAWVLLRDPKAPRKPARPAAKGARGPRKQKARPEQTKPASRPLLMIDGDNFAHRSYHALPKTILGKNGEPAGAVLGFANFLMRIYRSEEPRAVLVAWD